MIVKIPKYYKEFHCIADRCKHTCCKGWEIEIDPESYRHYLSVTGPFGERLRDAMKNDKHPTFRMVHGKCPFLKKDQLCEMYEELGAQSLCEVCTEYPRTEVSYGDTVEKLMVLSCEEACRLLFSDTEKLEFMETEVAGHDVVETLESLEETVLSGRQVAFGILQDRSMTIGERFRLFLQLGEQVQASIDQKASADNVGANLALTSHELFQRRMEILAGMEVMEEEWGEELQNVIRAFASDSQEGLYLEVSKHFASYEFSHDYEYEHLLVYFAARYLVDAIQDGKFLAKVKFCLLCYLTVRDMDRMRFLINGDVFSLADRIENVRIFCKEVEHSKKSMEYLMKNIEMNEVFLSEAILQQING